MKKWGIYTILHELEKRLSAISSAPPTIVKIGDKSITLPTPRQPDQVVIMGRFDVILEIIKERHLERQIDIGKIFKEVIYLSRSVSLSSCFHTPEAYIIELAKDLEKGIVWPSIRFPQIPPRQKLFSLAEVAKITGRTDKTIRNDIDLGKLIAEKDGRRRVVLKKNLIKYKRQVK